MNRFGRPDPFLIATHRERSICNIFVRLRGDPGTLKHIYSEGSVIGALLSRSISDAKSEPAQEAVLGAERAPQNLPTKALAQVMVSPVFSFTISGSGWGGGEGIAVRAGKRVAAQIRKEKH